MGYSIDEIARKLKITIDTLASWESGQDYPTLATARKLAGFYKRPLALFFMPNPPKTEQLPAVFRTLWKDKAETLSPESRLAIRRAKRLRKTAIDLASVLGENSKLQAEKIYITTNYARIEEITSFERSKLRIGENDIIQMRDEYVALRFWRDALSENNILIFQFNFPVTDMRAFALYYPEYPVIAFSSKDSMKARIFSVLHEYAHVLLRKDDILFITPENNKEEIFSNGFAGAILVPKEVLNKDPITQLPESELSDEVFQAASRRFKVSRQVILRRLLILGVVTQKFFDKKSAEWESTSYTPPKPSEWGPSVPVRCLSEKGAKFSSLVIRAFNAGAINYGEVSEILNVKVAHIPEIAARVGAEV